MNNKITVTGFEIEMIKIEEIQKEVDELLYNENWFIRFFGFHKAKKLHFKAEQAMKELFAKELIEDDLESTRYALEKSWINLKNKGCLDSYNKKSPYYQGEK